MEINKKINTQIYIIFTILIIVVFFMVFFSATLSYFKNQTNAAGQITLGELDFNIIISFPNNSVMPGDTIETNATIENKVKNKTNLIPFYFRFKLDNAEYIQLNINTNNFVLGEDGYYYCKTKVLKNDSKVLFNSFKIDENLQDINSLNFGISVDAVQSEFGAYKDIFPTAPIEWVEFIENN